jgi:hypothetical protein
MAEPSNGCASRVAHAASPSRRHCIRATPTVLPTKQCPLQIFPVALDAAMQRTRSLTPRESRSYYQARSQNLPIESVAHWLGWGLSSLCSANCTDFDLPLRRHHVHQRGSSGGRWNAMGSRIPFLLFIFYFCIFRSNPSLTICSWGRDRRVNLTHCIFFFLLFISTCALRLCLSLTFGVLLPVSVNFVMQEFFFLKKYYTVIWAVSVGHLGCWWLSMEPPSVRAISFSCARTTAAANGPCGWNPVKS